jgi:hypothetical protein
LLFSEIKKQQLLKPGLVSRGFFVTFQLSFNFKTNKTCLGRFQVLRYKTFTSILGPIQENGFPVKIRNKIKVKFRVRNKGKIQG